MYNVWDTQMQCSAVFDVSREGRNWFVLVRYSEQPAIVFTVCSKRSLGLGSLYGSSHPFRLAEVRAANGALFIATRMYVPPSQERGRLEFEPGSTNGAGHGNGKKGSSRERECRTEAACLVEARVLEISKSSFSTSWCPEPIPDI